MPIALKRAYEPPEESDGYRVLADRLWPRGLSRDKAKIDLWLKESAPSDELRRAFHNGALNRGEFRRQYLSELKQHKEELRELAERSRHERVTLVFSSKDIEHNNAVVLKEYLHRLGAR